jgi:hypothetical protein
MKLLAVTALLLCTAALSGCKDTTFEAPPSDTVSACDAQFVGKWRLLASDDKRGDDDAYYVIVERGCKRWRFIEDGKDDAKTEQTVHLSFAKAGDVPLLLVRMDPEKSSATDAHARWSNGYMYLRYEAAEKTLRLHPVDNAHMAHLIVDGAVSGRTERITREPGDKSARETNEKELRLKSTAHDELHNFVAGDSAEMARVAQLENIFDAHDFYTLKPATDAEIFRAKKKPAKP